MMSCFKLQPTTRNPRGVATVYVPSLSKGQWGGEWENVCVCVFVYHPSDWTDSSTSAMFYSDGGNTFYVPPSCPTLHTFSWGQPRLPASVPAAAAPVLLSMAGVEVAWAEGTSIQ